MEWRPDVSPGVLLWRAANSWQRALRQSLKQHNLTQAQFLVMASLAYLEGRQQATQQDLAQFSGVDVAAVSTVLGQLEGRGLVRRRIGTDARSRYPELTATGRAAVRTVMPDAAACDGEVFKPLGTNGSMFAGALQLLLGLRPRISAR